MKRFLSDESLVALIASALSLTALFYYFRAGELLLYGDAVAHISIARRVVDSLTPGPLQLGTVWLPLPHILMLPFVAWDWAWMTGVAGAIPSMLAYVGGSLGLFRLARLFMPPPAAWVAVLIFAGNPNLLYMQTTGMTEPLFLATVIWSVYFFCKFAIGLRMSQVDQASEDLVKCSMSLSAAMFTRYDGWFLTMATGLPVLGLVAVMDPGVRRRLRRPLVTFILVTALAPALWLAYNYTVYGNALEFMNGPYSARAIQEKTTRVMGSRHPGDRDVRTAKSFFMKAAKLNVGEGQWQHWMFGVAVFAGLVSLLQKRRRPLLLLWLPLLFYTLSIAYGSVPIFVPEWWPHAYVNVRYGLQLLPAMAIFFALAVEMVRQVNYSPRVNGITLTIAIASVFLSEASVWMAGPICLREARANGVGRMLVESALATQLKELPSGSRLMMFTGTHSGALQRAGIPFKRVLNEGNYPEWDEALKVPASGADYIVAGDNDLIANAVGHNGANLEAVVNLKVEGEEIRIYRSTIYNDGRWESKSKSTQ